MTRNEIGPKNNNIGEQKKIKESYELIKEINNFVKQRNKSIQELKKDTESTNMEQSVEFSKDLEDIKEKLNEDVRISKKELNEDIEITKEKQNIKSRKDAADGHLSKDSFWGEDFEDILDSFINNEYKIQSPIEEEISSVNIEEQDNPLNNVKNEKENVENLEKCNIGENEKTDVENVKEHDIDKDKAVNSKSDNNITKEIQSIRRKYIVGKIVGEDLFDNNHNLIVAKDSVITMEIIDRAEGEGKLVELIIGMKLPERT